MKIACNATSAKCECNYLYYGNPYIRCFPVTQEMMIDLCDGTCNVHEGNFIKKIDFSKKLFSLVDCETVLNSEEITFQKVIL